MTTGFDIALIADQDLGDFPPDELFTIGTVANFYLSNGAVPLQTASRRITFERPDGSTFFVEYPDVTIGSGNLSTPKGTFTSGCYLVYPVAWDKFTYPGKWRAFLPSSGQGASFVVFPSALAAYSTETGNILYCTEDGNALYVVES